MISRRAFLKGALSSGAAVAGAGSLYTELSHNFATNPISLEEVTATLPSLPSAFDGYRIGFLTDIHLGIWLPSEWIEQSLRRLQSKDIDLLALGGDYIMINDMPLWQTLGLMRNPSFAKLHPREASTLIYREVADLISRFTFADGTLAVAGNHDHWNYFPLFESTFRRYPRIRLLINQEIVVKRGEAELSFFGVDDFLTGLPTAPPPRAPAGRQTTRILLSHNPDYVSATLSHNVADFDLALCGHTHGGQVRIPGIGPLALQITDARFAAGLVDTGQSQKVYTSRGLGFVGVPFRVDCPPEVTIITLRCA